MADQTPLSPRDSTLDRPPVDSGDSNRDHYRVRLEGFEGPLDLLLFLIKKEELDIANIPIARITEQYLEYLSLMEQLDIAVAGDFLVMASTLIYIKSKMLLPPPPPDSILATDESLLEDPRAELVARLLEYQKFKSAANMLYSKGEVEAACFTRGTLESDEQNPEVSATVFDILRVFRDILQRLESAVEMEIQRDEITMAEKLAEIEAMLAEQQEINIRDLFLRSRSKRELIVTFLAFLELVKAMKIRLIQRELFGEIYARRKEPETLPLPEPPTSSQEGPDPL